VAHQSHGRRERNAGPMRSTAGAFFAGFFTKRVIVMGARLPDPKIFPPSWRESSPLVR